MSFLSKVTSASKRSLYRFIVVTLSVLLAFTTIMVNPQHAAALRLQYRSLYINSSLPGARTFYTVSFRHPTSRVIGSVQMLFCMEAVPEIACDPPVGLDVSDAIMTSQNGETGYTLTTQTQNRLVIARTPTMTGGDMVSYTFDNVVNPTGAPDTFYVRLATYASNDATGPVLDFGSPANTTTQTVGLITQVPPYLVFCTGKTIPGADCSDPQGPNFEEFPNPSAEEAMITSSEMMAYTNARNGLSIVVTGRTLTSGIHEIDPIVGAPEESIPGKGQFGINLTENDDPIVGGFPTGPGVNAVLNGDYTQTNKFVFNPNDILVASNGVTRPRKFTVSYVVNIPPDIQPGVYNTTVTYICTGSF